MAKVLLLAIETLPGTAYGWSLWGENVPLERLIQPSRVVCWAAQWYGEKEVMFGSEWGVGHLAMLQRIWDLIAEADAVITYNGDKFDLPKLQGEFAEYRLGNPGPVASIDLYKTARKLGYMSNKLAHVAPHLGIGEKTKHTGFDLWQRVDEGDDAQALELMEKYNKQDVRLLARLYKRLRPFIKNHPFLGEEAGKCPCCQSSRVQRRGRRRTKAFFIERLHCQSCGTWFDGKRSKVK